jgi:hypothetical protein
VHALKQPRVPEPKRGSDYRKSSPLALFGWLSVCLFGCWVFLFFFALYLCRIVRLSVCLCLFNDLVVSLFAAPLV